MGRMYKDYWGDEYKKARILIEPSYASLANKIDEEDVELRKKALEGFLSRFYLNIQSALDYGGNGDAIPFPCAAYTPYSGKPHPTKLYDIIFCCHVLEHVSYPAEVLEKIKSLRSFSSHIYLEVPLEIDENKTDFNGQFFHEHINFFTKRSLEKLAENAGLIPSIIEYFPIKQSTGDRTFIRGLFT